MGKFAKYARVTTALSLAALSTAFFAFGIWFREPSIVACSIPGLLFWAAIAGWASASEGRFKFRPLRH